MTNKFLPEKEKTNKLEEKHYKEIESVSTSSLIDNFINNSNPEDIKKINNKVEEKIKETDSKSNIEEEKVTTAMSGDDRLLAMNVIILICTILSLLAETFNPNGIFVIISGILLLILFILSIITACACSDSSYRTFGVLFVAFCIVFFLYYCGLIVLGVINAFQSGCSQLFRGCE